jgi:ribokinase
VARVVGIGACNIDYLGVVDRYPPLGRKQELVEFSIQGGGAVPTALTTLAAFGVGTEFVSKISDDDFGRFLLRGFEDSRIGTRFLALEKGRISPFAFIAVERMSGRQTEYSMSGSVSELEASELRLEVLDGAEVLLLDGKQVGVQLRAAERARDLGITVVTDASTLREGSGDLLALTDVLLASERFAAEVAARAELVQSLDELRAMGPRTVVVTLGAEGSIGLQGAELVREPAAAIELIDTTGAGGVYRGAFIYGLLQRWDISRTMHFASVAAGLNCRAVGERAGIPDLEEVLSSL